MKEKMSHFVMDYVQKDGACAAGIATVETLRGGPPSTDLSYVLPGAKSAVSFAVPLDASLIEPFLSKKDRLSHERDNFRTNNQAGGIALGLAKNLSQKGFPSVPVAPNEVYRADAGRGAIDMHPDVSLRYLAVRSGVGFFGLSGNVLHPERGGAVILGAVVTTLELEPTDPLPPEEKYCGRCRLCMALCASGMMDPEEETTVTLGGHSFTYAKRRNYLRCEYVCGGFTGLHPSGKWSTWSPGRFAVPGEDDAYIPAIVAAMKKYGRWPRMPGGHYHLLMRDPLYLTCGHCQISCHPDREVRKRRHRMVVQSGCIVQNADGSLEALPPGEARRRVLAMPPEVRALYEEADPARQRRPGIFR
jgi:epoxyqueuosine reductase QueG